MALEDLSLAADMWVAQKRGAAALRSRQRTRLGALLRHTRTNSPFYQQAWKGLPDHGFALSDVPPVTKSELMADFDAWVCDPAVTREAVERFLREDTDLGAEFLGRYLVCTSSGTTGHPGLYLYDKRTVDVFRALAYARINPAWLGPRDWADLARRGIRWTAVVGTGGHFAGEVWMASEGRRDRWHRRRYRTLSIQRPVDEVVTGLNVSDPTILSTYPSNLALLAEKASERSLRIRPVFIEATGETLSTSVRQHAEQSFGCPVHNVYATSEFQCIAVECHRGRLHVNSDWLILEPIDRGGRPVAPGEASHSVLLTNLANRLQPLVRYDLGDSITFDPHGCECASALPVIRVTGRCDDVLELRSAGGQTVRIPPLAIGSVAEDATRASPCQIVQAGPSRLTVHTDPLAAARSAADAVRRWLTGQGLDGVVVTASPEPPHRSAVSGKFRQIIRQDPG